MSSTEVIVIILVKSLSGFERPLSLNRFLDEFSNVEISGSKVEAKALSKEQREKYDLHRPHS